MNTIQHKRGDTLKWTCTYNIDGVPSALPAGILAQLRTGNDNLVSAMTVVRIDEPGGQYSLTVEATETAQWRLGLLVGDIQYTTSSGEVASTETFQINVVRDWSRA